MAVEDKYTNADIVDGKKPSAINGGVGTELYFMEATVAVAAADDNGSVYRAFKGVPANYVPVKVAVYNTAVTGGTDYDLGLYGTDTGAVVDADILADGISMATARTIATENNAGLTTLDIANGTQTLATLSAQTNTDSSYDIALTANTVGTASGTIKLHAWFGTK